MLALTDGLHQLYDANEAVEGRTAEVLLAAPHIVCALAKVPCGL